MSDAPGLGEPPGASRPEPFELHGVVYLDQPAGRSATNLAELLEQVAQADAETLFVHTQMPRLRHPAGDDLPVDDFSGWVRGVVQDVATAERLAFAIHSADGAPEPMRAAITRVLESVPSRARVEHAAPMGGAFVMMRFDSIEVPTDLFASTPDELMEALARSDRGTWFHHLIEQAWFGGAGPRGAGALEASTHEAGGGGSPPIIEWLRAAGDPRLARVLEREAASGRSVEQLRARSLSRWRRSRIGSRVIRASLGEAERAAGTREAAGRLARRLAGVRPAGRSAGTRSAGTGTTGTGTAGEGHS